MRILQGQLLVKIQDAPCDLEADGLIRKRSAKPAVVAAQSPTVNLGWKLAAVLNGRVKSSLIATYEAERRPAAERLIMHSRAQLALLRPGPEVTALRELFSELITNPDTVRRLSDVLSGADNRYTMSADMHPLAGRWVPDFAVAGSTGLQRIAELACSGRPVVVDLTESGAVAASLSDVADQLIIATGRAVGDVPATAIVVRPDGYVAWASSQARPEPDELRELRAVLTYWFGI